MKPKLRFPGFQDDWEEKKLGEVVSIPNKKITIDNKIFNKYVSTENLKKDFSGVSFPNYTSETKVIEFKSNDVLMGNIRPYLNKFWLATHDGGASNDINIFRSRGKIDSYFLYYSIANESFTNEVMQTSTGTKMPRGNKKEMLNIKISIPSLSEQKKVGEFLSKIDERIEKQEEKVERLKERKKGWMQQLFSQSIRFKDENGQDYPAWEEKKLGEVAEIKGGYAFKSQDFTDKGVPVITISNIGKYIYNNQLFAYSTLEDKKILIGEEKDVLVALSGATTGKSGQIKEGKYYINQRIARIRHLNSNNLNSYIFNWINSNDFYTQLNKLLVAGAQPNLSILDLNNLRIFVPSLPEQEKIAEFLSKQDELIEKEEAKLSLLKEQKKGLLQQMFV